MFLTSYAVANLLWLLVMDTTSFTVQNMHAVANCYYIFMNMHIHTCFIACSFLFILRTLFVIIHTVMLHMCMCRY